MGQQFKVGDRVRLTEPRVSWGLKVGATGTVAENGSDIPFVEWDNFTEGHSGPFHDGRTTCMAVNMDGLELIQPQPTAESLLLALGTASRELEDAITAEREAHAAVAEAVTRREQAAEAHAEAMKAIRKAAMARAA